MLTAYFHRSVMEMQPFSNTVVLFFLLVVFVSLPPSSSLSFSFASFNSTTILSNITFQGDAAVANGSIFLTQSVSSAGPGFNVGRAKYSRPVPLWDPSTGASASFTSNFTFTMGNPVSNYTADGLAFFITVADSTIPPDSNGGHLGLFRDQGLAAVQQTPMVVAVEVDTSKNIWDPDGTHVGIDVGNIISVVTAPWKVKSLVGFVRVSAWVRYDAASQNFSARMLDENGGSLALSTVLNLSSLVPAWADIGFSAGTGAAFGTHVINSWSFESTLAAKPAISAAPPGVAGGVPGGPRMEENEGRYRRRRSAVIFIAAVSSSSAVVFLLVLVWFLWRRKKMQEEETKSRGLKEMEGVVVREFRYKELAEATDGFSEDREVGRGGFGVVYRGVLKGSEEVVAVKKVLHRSKDGEASFVSEVNAISRLRHRNLVKLRGWCHEQDHSLLVYEFMPNRSLDTHIFGEAASTSSLPWPERYRAAIGLASALYYIHEACDQTVLHRDIKSSNVMLDSSLNVKLGDFGLARLVEHGISSPTTVLAGTLGYLAPECFRTQRFTKKSDVYSFGILALEIACGKRATQAVSATASGETTETTSSGLSLVERVWSLYWEGCLLDTADEKLGSEFDAREMERLMVVGLWCSSLDHTQRPNISSALAVLSFEAPLPTLRQEDVSRRASFPVHLPVVEKDSIPMIAAAGAN